MEIKVTKGKQTLGVDDACLPAWEKAGWKQVISDKTEKETKTPK